MITGTLLVTSVMSLSEYHAELQAGLRRTTLYKRCAMSGELVLRKTARLPAGHKPGGSDLNGKVLLGTVYRRFASDLAGTPVVPEAVLEQVPRLGQGVRPVLPADAPRLARLVRSVLN